MLQQKASDPLWANISPSLHSYDVNPLMPDLSECYVMARRFIIQWCETFNAGKQGAAWFKVFKRWHVTLGSKWLHGRWNSTMSVGINGILSKEQRAWVNNSSITLIARAFSALPLLKKQSRYTASAGRSPDLIIHLQVRLPRCAFIALQKGRPVIRVSEDEAVHKPKGGKNIKLLLKSRDISFHQLYVVSIKATFLL